MNAHGFQDLENVADAMFATWESDGERRWASYAYDVLHKHHVTRDDVDLDHAENGVVLCTLGALSKSFYSYAFGEGQFDDWTYELHPVIGDHPLISPVAVGRLAERYEIPVGADDRDEDPSTLLIHLIRGRTAEVSGALIAEFGPSVLLVNMWAARDGSTSYPLPDDHGAWAQLTSPSDDTQLAFAWITDGMPL